MPAEPGSRSSSQRAAPEAGAGGPAFLQVLRLVRLPNCLTGVADVLAGAALTGADPLAPLSLTAALGSGMLYGGGVALGDLRDREKDLRLHPHRPLPSGHLTPAGALITALVLLATGTLSGFPGGSEHRTVTAGLLAAILGYLFLAERRPALSPWIMGSCRSLNLLRGATLSASPLGWKPALGAAGLFVLILAVTRISALEERTSTESRPMASAGLLFLAWQTPFLISLGEPRGDLSLVAGLAALGGLLATWILLPVLGSPGRAGSTVRRAIFTLVLLDAAFALAAGAPLAALVLTGMLPLIHLLAGLIRQQGA